MRTSVDRFGRLVLPKALRDEVGITPGEVEVTLDGAGLRVEPVAVDSVVERNSRVYLARAGHTRTSDDVRELRLRGQR